MAYGRMDAFHGGYVGFLRGVETPGVIGMKSRDVVMLAATVCAAPRPLPRIEVQTRSLSLDTQCRTCETADDCLSASFDATPITPIAPGSATLPWPTSETGKRRSAVNFWDRLEAVGEQHSVLRHSFYLRWSEGSLGIAELAHYSGQYRHAVIALADATAAAARSPEAGADAPVLALHAAEEAAHVELWDEFVAAVGGEVGAEASEETRACAAVWAGDESRPLLQTLAAMYTIESAQPAISTTKQAGLALHYGIPAVAYFEVHQRLDLEHAAQARRLINQRLAAADEDTLVATAEVVLKANLLLLDGVDAACGHS